MIYPIPQKSHSTKKECFSPKFDRDYHTFAGRKPNFSYLLEDQEQEKFIKMVAREQVKYHYNRVSVAYYVNAKETIGKIDETKDHREEYYSWARVVQNIQTRKFHVIPCPEPKGNFPERCPLV